MNHTTHTNTYNTDASLWVSFFHAYPNTNLTYVSGGVFVNGECRAMFNSQKAAIATMTEARRLAGVE